MSVTLDHVTRRWMASRTIRDVSLTLERGTLSVLLGPTLSGKTSIMRLLAGLDKPTPGPRAGRAARTSPASTCGSARSRWSISSSSIIPRCTVYENIASPLRVQGRPTREIEKRVLEAAACCGLEPYLKRTPLQLSGGQQQRTAIARALVKGADLVLLDEPLANLDYKLREEAARRAAAHLRGLRRDLRLCHHRTVRSAAARRQYRRACGKARCCRSARRSSVYRHPDTLRVAAGVLRSAAQHHRHREEERLCAVCRWHRRRRRPALRGPRRRHLPRRLPRPSARSRQRHRRVPPHIPRRP